eukprot:scaffold179707_cov34-Tisochrysis_lutea.AAC.5
MDSPFSRDGIRLQEEALMQALKRAVQLACGVCVAGKSRREDLCLRGKRRWWSKHHRAERSRNG